jgi:hypothetical protein
MEWRSSKQVILAIGIEALEVKKLLRKIPIFGLDCVMESCAALDKIHKDNMSFEIPFIFTWFFIKTMAMLSMKRRLDEKV